MLDIKNRSSEQIQMIITFYFDVQLCPIVDQDEQNSEQKVWAKSNDNNFLLGCPIESRNISRRSKLKMEARSKCKPQ